VPAPNSSVCCARSIAIAFRPAAAEDVEPAVALIYSSGPAAFDLVFSHGRPNGAQDFLAYAFRQGGGEFGWRNHVAGVEAGRVVAIGAGWDGKQSIAFTLAAARQIFGFFGPVKAWGVILRGLKVESVIRPAGAGELFYVGHLGVDPAMRSRGLGAQLVAHLLASASACPKAVLDVNVGNPRAQALYERLGFIVTATRVSKLHSRYGSVGDHRRMEKQLGSV
jgi:ribosomal protein S18 acetylase RimI-like enzyme